MIRQEVAAACFRSRPRRPPQPKRFSVGPSRGLPPSIRPRRSPRTCPTTPTTPADFRAPPNARPSNPYSPSPLAVAISAARGFLPRRLSDAGPSALASASVPGRRPKPLTTPAGRNGQGAVFTDGLAIGSIYRNGARRGHADVYLAFATASHSLDRIELCTEDHHSPRPKTFSCSTPSHAFRAWPLPNRGLRRRSWAETAPTGSLRDGRNSCHSGPLP